MDLLQYIRQFHAIVDELAARVAAQHSGRLGCALGCASCCVDELTVFEVEAARIVAEFEGVLGQQPGPAGGCAFLDEAGACRIYAARPYVCRTQGLPLRWLEQEGGESFEARDICDLNLPGPGLETLPPEACWQLGPFEQRLAAVQAAADGGEERRVALRELFRAE